MIKFIFIFLTLCPSNALAGYSGRFTLGGFVTQESYDTEAVEAQSNDWAVVSSRLFLNIDELGDKEQELVFDLRDKHDFFDKLNPELRTLDEKNTFQVRQAAFKMRGMSLGRFPVLEAGAVYVDGLSVSYKFGQKFKLGAFTGYNPVILGQAHLETNTDQKISGVHTLYQKSSQEWYHYTYWSSAIVEQRYKEVRDRLYWFNNFSYQGSQKSYFNMISYLDFEPTQKVQNLWASQYYRFLNAVSTRLSYYTIDTIEYKRSQDVRETLDASRYQQAQLTLKHKIGLKQATVNYKYIKGVREVDDKSKSDASIGINLPEFMSKYLTSSFYIGKRANFISDDNYMTFGLLYNSAKYELSFDQSIIEETDDLSGTTTAYITDLSMTYLYSRKFFFVLSTQSVKDDDVSIFTVLFKLTYRFGSKGIPPTRDGASPRGRL